MARGTVLTEGIKRLITTVYLEHPQWRTKEIQKEVIKRSHQVMPYVDPNWPGLSAVQKELTKIRKKQSETPPDPEDNPWHVVTLADYDMPAEALPALLLIWGKTLEWGFEPLTIREAKWVARLYRLVTHIDFLYVYARHYALEEKVAKITGTLSPSAANVFFDEGIGLLPGAMETLYFRLGPVGLPDLEMIAASIYERPPKGAEEAAERLREMMAEVVRTAGLPKVILGELLRVLRKEARHERPHSQES